MAKLRDIDTCQECKHFEGYFDECQHDGVSGREVQPNALPDWCPLPDTGPKTFESHCMDSQTS